MNLPSLPAQSIAPPTAAPYVLLYLIPAAIATEPALYGCGGLLVDLPCRERRQLHIAGDALLGTDPVWRYCPDRTEAPCPLQVPPETPDE